MAELEVYDRVRVVSSITYRNPLREEIGSIVAIISGRYLVYFPQRDDLHNGGGWLEYYGVEYYSKWCTSLCYLRDDDLELVQKEER